MKILSYSEFDSNKRTVPVNNESEGVSRAILGHLGDFFKKEGKDASFEKASQYISSKVEGWELSKEDFKEAKEMLPENLNEGFLDAIVRFFKGMFDLFNDKDVKKDAEESEKYFSEIENDEEIPDEDLEEEIDPKRVRKISTNMNKHIVKRVETDEEKGIKTSKNLVEAFTGWLSMLFVYEDSLHMPFLEKMTKNPELAKRFTWVPKKWSFAGDTDTKEWYKQKECKPDPKILNTIVAISKMEGKEKESMTKKFAESFIKYVVESDKQNGSKFKEQDAEYLADLHAGLATMAASISSAMEGVLKNTPDDKLTEVIATEIVTKRKRKGSKKPTDKKADEKPKADEKENNRSRKGSKKTGTTATKPAAKPAAKTGAKGTTTTKTNTK